MRAIDFPLDPVTSLPVTHHHSHFVVIQPASGSCGPARRSSSNYKRNCDLGVSEILRLCYENVQKLLVFYIKRRIATERKRPTFVELSTPIDNPAPVWHVPDVRYDFRLFRSRLSWRVPCHKLVAYVSVTIRYFLASEYIPTPN